MPGPFGAYQALGGNTECLPLLTCRMPLLLLGGAALVKDFPTAAECEQAQAGTRREQRGYGAFDTVTHTPPFSSQLPPVRVGERTMKHPAVFARGDKVYALIRPGRRRNGSDEVTAERLPVIVVRAGLRGVGFVEDGAVGRKTEQADAVGFGCHHRQRSLELAAEARPPAVARS